MVSRRLLDLFRALYGSRLSGIRHQRRHARVQISRISRPPKRWFVVQTDMMGNSPRSRLTRQSSSGSGKGLLRGPRDLDSRRSARTSIAGPAKPLSPPASTSSDSGTASTATKQDSYNSSEDIAPEIVVWTEDMDDMMVDSPESATSTAPATPALVEKAAYVLCPFLSTGYCPSPPGSTRWNFLLNSYDIAANSPWRSSLDPTCHG